MVWPEREEGGREGGWEGGWVCEEEGGREGGREGRKEERTDFLELALEGGELGCGVLDAVLGDNELGEGRLDFGLLVGGGREGRSGLTDATKACVGELGFWK